MKILFPGTSRAICEWIAVTVSCALIAAAVVNYGWLWRIDQVFYDVAMSTVDRQADEDLLIVAIDEQSLAELGRWPWRRAVHGRLIERLRQAGSGPVALDVIFAEPDLSDPPSDRVLVDALRAHGRVVLPLPPASGSSVVDGASMFAGDAAAVGHVHVEFDPDGIVRSVYLWEREGDRTIPQLALALLQLTDPVLAARYAEHWPGDEDPGRTGLFRIPFAGPPGAIERVSFVDVLQGRVAATRIAGRTVVIGAVANGMGDVVPTPTSAFTRPMAGVEVNANIYSALRNGGGIGALQPSMAILLSASPVLLLMLAMVRLSPREALIAAFGVSAVALFVPWLMLQQMQLWLPPAGALVGCMLAYPLWSWRRLEATQHYLDEELDALQREADRWRPIAGNTESERVSADPIDRRLAVLREIASRQRTLRDFMMDTLDGLPTGVVVVDPAGSVALYNRRACSLLGGTGPDDLLAALRAIDWPPELKPQRGLPASPREPVSTEVGAADECKLLVTIAAMHGRRWPSDALVLTLDDITQVKQAQERRESAMQYLSHDLRSPLSSIVTMVESFDDDEFATGVPREELRRVGLFARSALELTENLFRLVRAEGVDVRKFSVYDLNQLIDDAAEEAWALARAKSIKVVREDGGIEDCPVSCEPGMLKRALLNLLTNAIKYSPEGSEVHVALGREPRGWRLEVRDQGDGISEEDQRLLFKRFGRLEKSTGRRVAGLGLGLMIVKTVVERHGGSVEVSSQPGVGSTFTIRLPLAQA
ncbi:MAG: CHASE2 domain-containing protein [Rhodocyclaceae bacterium]|nr:CHASE2 domain-containing protein [Rhodocyclaceae bacterium]